MPVFIVFTSTFAHGQAIVAAADIVNAITASAKVVNFHIKVILV